MPANLAEITENELFKRARRDAADRAFRGAAILAHMRAGVIEIRLPIGILLAAWIRGERCAAVPALQKPFQKMDVLVAPLEFGGLGFLRLDRFVGLVPELRRHQSRMFRRVFLVAMLDDSLIHMGLLRIALTRSPMNRFSPTTRWLPSARTNTRCRVRLPVSLRILATSVALRNFTASWYMSQIKSPSSGAGWSCWVALSYS